MLREVGDALFPSRPFPVGHQPLLFTRGNQELAPTQLPPPQATWIWSAVTKLYLTFPVHLHCRSSVPGHPQIMPGTLTVSLRYPRPIRAISMVGVESLPDSTRGLLGITSQRGCTSVGSLSSDPVAPTPEHADREAELS